MEIGTAFAEGRLTAYLTGEWDQHEARRAMEKLDELLEEYLPRDLVVDLSGLRFMDSSGIALLIRLSRRLRETGGRMWIENPAQQPKRVIDTAGIDRLIPVSVRKL